MNKTAIIHARIEPDTKKQAEGVLKQLGLSSTDAIRMFYKQICLHKGLPFHVKIPNKVTKSTLTKSQQNKKIESFDSLEEMFSSWKK